MIRRGVDIEPFIDGVNKVILERPVAVIVAVVVLTAVFAGGVPLITVEDDETDGFTEGIPEQEAFEAINDEFGDPFSDTGGDSTQIIHVDGNALSQQALVQNLRFIETIEDREHLRVEGVQGPAQMVAVQLDPDAQTVTEQRRAVEQASGTEVRQVVRALDGNGVFEQSVSEDFNPSDPSADATVTTVVHDVPSGASDEMMEEIQLEVESLADRSDGDLRAFGGALLNAETGEVIGDSMLIVVPLVIGMILLFLTVAYRDPVDLILALLVLITTLIWTFGFMGYAEIPFNQQMIAVPIILLAVGVDFGIHAVNRYREEREQGHAPVAAMRNASDQVLVAFFIVAATTAFGFGANLISPLEPTQNFGIVAAVGIIFTFVLFGVFMPAVKVAVDRYRGQVGIPEFGTKPIASEDSVLGRVLSVTVTGARIAPALLVITFIAFGAGAAAYGQGVDQTFDTDDFLPPEDIPSYIEDLPEPFAPSDYRVAERISFLEDNFETGQGETVIIYLEGPFTEGHALESVERAHENPPDTFVTVDDPDGGESVDQDSIITEIQTQAQQDSEFAAVVERNDRSGSGVPDRNLDRVYNELEGVESASTGEYITDDRRAIQIEYTVEGDAEMGDVREDADAFTDEFRYDATPTGQIIVFQAITDLIFESAIDSLIIAIGSTSLFLIVVYGAIERRPLLGLVNIFPILATVALLLATMRAAGLPLNALTGSILAITIGVGVAYSVHITHRFIDEYTESLDAEDALTTTLRGTGGALTGSMLTTALGTGALMLAISPVLGDFGLLLAVSVVYSYVMAIVALPPALFVWAAYDARTNGRVSR